jgi:predicted DCC family thiol-disulfide oxidoreductase YuxK
MTPEIVFFDGHCGLCHHTVHFLLGRDRAGRFVFAPLGGETYLATFGPDERARLPESVVVRTSDGRTLVRSDASVHMLRALGGAWGVLGAVLRIIPRPLRDLLYRGVARTRRVLFRQPEGACPVVAPALRSRFRP